jgi:AraC-like DNA-binding protein
MRALRLPVWWPGRELGQNPVKNVFVCGRQLDPPFYAQVINFPRLEIPLRGCYENQLEINGQTVRVKLRPGDALFAAANCWNLPAWQPGLELMLIHFGRKQLGISIVTARSRKSAQLSAKKFSCPRPLTGPVPHILEAMIELQAAGGPAEVFPELTRALLPCLLKLFRQPAAAASGRAHSLLENICVFLQNHYQNDITRDSVARQFDVTPNHLSRLFQTHGHMTFSSYLTHVRIDRAKLLLRSCNLKLDDIATRSGYRDTPYFCHVFKRLTQATPAEYRIKVRLQRSEAD